MIIVNLFCYRKLLKKSFLGQATQEHTAHGGIKQVLTSGHQAFVILA